MRSALSTVPSNARFLRGQLQNLRMPGSKEVRPARACEAARSIDKLAFTMTTSSGFRFMDRRYRRIRVITVREKMLLQGFDERCLLPDARSGDLHKLVGNALPPLVVRVLLTPL